MSDLKTNGHFFQVSVASPSGEEPGGTARARLGHLPDGCPLYFYCHSYAVPPTSTSPGCLKYCLSAQGMYAGCTLKRIYLFCIFIFSEDAISISCCHFSFHKHLGSLCSGGCNFYSSCKAQFITPNELLWIVHQNE